LPDGTWIDAADDAADGDRSGAGIHVTDYARAARIGVADRVVCCVAVAVSLSEVEQVLEGSCCRRMGLRGLLVAESVGRVGARSHRAAARHTPAQSLARVRVRYAIGVEGRG